MADMFSRIMFTWQVCSVEKNVHRTEESKRIKFNSIYFLTNNNTRAEGCKVAREYCQRVKISRLKMLIILEVLMIQLFFFVQEGHNE
jgi:hypothetical protein